MKPNNNNVERKSEKKAFDKKKYREKKYSHKFKVQQFEDRRKKKVLRKYYKQLKYISAPGASNPYENDPDFQSQQVTPHIKMTSTQRARMEFERIQQQKVEKKAELEQKKAEKEQKLKEYKEKKAEKFRTLSKKTRKGQPVMKGRLEMLLEKIQKQTS